MLFFLIDFDLKILKKQPYHIPQISLLSLLKNLIFTKKKHVPKILPPLFGCVADYQHKLSARF
jgi:hypothetical protein